MKTKYKIGIQLIGFRFITLGIIILFDFAELSLFGYILAILYILVGFGVVKYNKIVRIIAILIPFFTTAYYIYIIFLLRDSCLSLEALSFNPYPVRYRMNITIYKAIINLIIAIFIMIFFNRPKVKKLFKK